MEERYHHHHPRSGKMNLNATVGNNPHQQSSLSSSLSHSSANGSCVNYASTLPRVVGTSFESIPRSLELKPIQFTPSSSSNGTNKNNSNINMMNNNNNYNLNNNMISNINNNINSNTRNNLTSASNAATTTSTPFAAVVPSAHLQNDDDDGPNGGVSYNVKKDDNSNTASTSTTANINNRNHNGNLPRNGSSSLSNTNNRRGSGSGISGSNRKLIGIAAAAADPEQQQRGGAGGETMMMIRPTYGAYTSNTLPRGPYLQYKIHDNRQQLQQPSQQLKFATIANPSHLIKTQRQQQQQQQEQQQHLMSDNNNNYSNLRGTQTLERYNSKRNNNKFADQPMTLNPAMSLDTLKTTQQPLSRGHPNAGSSSSLYLSHQSRIQNANSSLDVYNGTHSRVHQAPTTSSSSSSITSLYARASHQQQPPNGRNQYSNGLKNGSIISTKNEWQQVVSNGISVRRISPSLPFSENMMNLINSQTANQMNCVTLDEILAVHPKGLNVSEGWALLCQSVQALQDLFLADTPSTTRILPLVTPSSLQITCRGRVAFHITPVGQLSKFTSLPVLGSNGTNVDGHLQQKEFATMLDFLSPEFINTMGKRVTFTESDIEKMWIYSLGITLRKTIPGDTKVGSTCHLNDGRLIVRKGELHHHHQQQQPGRPCYSIPNTNQFHKEGDRGHLEARIPTSSLEYVIASMCNDLEQRSSLMYLLDVISDYCKTHHQVKPFSHIVMELFQEAVNHKSQNQANLYNKKRHFDEKSDTDSGRSSDHGEQYKEPPKPDCRKLEVKRLPTIKSAESSPIKKVDVKPEAPANGLQVIRRKRRRETFRRNTIDVNRLELKEAEERLLPKINNNLINISKSTNCIDKLLVQEKNEFHKKIEEMTFHGGISMPDLKAEKLFDENPKLSIRRPVNSELEHNMKIRQCLSVDNFTNCSSNLKEFQLESGPDFIVKSFVTPKQIDLTDEKCLIKKVVNVLLINGTIIQVWCNPTQTTAGEIFSAIVRSENYVENYFLGLCAIIGGDFVFLPMDLKVYKVAPQMWVNVQKKVGAPSQDNLSPFSLFIRIKFYLPTLRGLNSLESRHLLYLQLRKSVLERHILCTDDDLITLGGLALQAEMGDFKENMKYVEYFTISHYLPDGVYQTNRELSKYLRNSHYLKRGLHALEAEHNFIRYVQELKEFGLHLYSAVWTMDDNTSLDIFLAISISGICLFERSCVNENNNHINGSFDSKLMFQRKLFAKFEWLEIENLCYSKHILCVVVRSRESLNAKDNNRIKYKLRMDGRKSYFAFCLASDHHRFYMKLRNSFVSLKEISHEFNISLRNPHTITPTANNMDSEKGTDSEGPQSLDSCGHLPKIDKPTKATGLRMKNLKKSMLNDNKLVKLRQKFLKRSKSVTEMSIGSNPINDSIEPQSETKENENPSLESSPKTMNTSWNRNKVKMGTRVFSTQFLNKSFDNICDNAVNIARLEAVSGTNNSFYSPGVNSHNMSCSSFTPIDELDSQEEEDLDLELKRGRINNRKFETEAYVVQESIKSTLDQFSLPNETISDTLLDKFNNISCNTSMDDRVIKKLLIIKDPISNSKESETDKSSNYIEGKPPKVPKSTFERLKFATLNSNRFSKRFIKAKNKFLAKNPDSTNKSEMDLRVRDALMTSQFTLGISIVQGSDNNVYVKDMVPNGAGARNGIMVGDQILAVDGISLLTLSYEDSLKLLQTSGKTVELVISQLARRNSTPIRNNLSSKSVDNFQNLELQTVVEQQKDDLLMDDAVEKYFSTMKEQYQKENNMFYQNGIDSNGLSSVSINLSKSVPDLPKVVGIIPKRVSKAPALPRSLGLSRKYFGPVRYPVTPAKIPMLKTEAPNVGRKQLSLLVDIDDGQVFI